LQKDTIANPRLPSSCRGVKQQLDVKNHIKYQVKSNSLKEKIVVKISFYPI